MITKANKRVKDTKSAFFIVIWLIFIGTVLFLSYFLYTHFNKLVDSDISSELILARQLADEKSIISRNWYYATELHVFSAQLVYEFLFLLFSNWLKIRIAGCVMCYVILLFSAKCLCRSLGISRLFPVIGIFMMIPFSYDYFEFVLMNVYYIPNLVFLLLVISIAISVMNSKNHKNILITLSALLSVACGTNGARMILMLFIPLFLTAILNRVLSVKTNGLNITNMMYKSNRLLLISIVDTIGVVLGYLINAVILSKNYYFLKWNVSLHGITFDNMPKVLSGFARELGYSSGTNTAQAYIADFFSVAVIALTVFFIIYALTHKEKISDGFFIISLFTLFAVIVFIGLYLVADMLYWDRYNIPIIICSFFVILCGLQEYKTTKFRNSKAVLLCTLAVLMVITASMQYWTISRMDKTKELRAIAEWLPENGYYNGYATYWNANVLTELSNGQEEMYSWVDAGQEGGNLMETVSDPTHIFKWLQPMSHSENKPEGKVFMLLTGDEAKYCQWKLDYSHVVWGTDNYIIYGFDSFDDYLASTTGS